VAVLAGCIREIRRALGDDARAAHFIETAHRRGYRFIAAAVVSALPAAAPHAMISRFLRLGRDTELAALARQFAQAVTALVAPGRRERGSRSTAIRHAVRGRPRSQQDRKKGVGRTLR
jgi:hypothetical protein